jgi:hypothetical protein
MVTIFNAKANNVMGASKKRLLKKKEHELFEDDMKRTLVHLPTLVSLQIFGQRLIIVGLV